MTIIISNFSIGEEEWAAASGINFSVDVTDNTYGISMSGTYFIHDGNIVPTSFSGIIDGYTCYYYPTNVYSDGTIDLTIHAQNTVSGVKDQTFHLLYGYNLEFEKLIDWGPKNEVITVVKAKNLAFCPNLEGEAIYFETADLQSTDLSATIQAIESVNLGATIYPQSTTFFYGRTYIVTVSEVRDYHGNKMDPYTIQFTIEDPTS
jgi:hypothetical protein